MKTNRAHDQVESSFYQTCIANLSRYSQTISCQNRFQRLVMLLCFQKYPVFRKRGKQLWSFKLITMHLKNFPMDFQHFIHFKERRNVTILKCVNVSIYNWEISKIGVWAQYTGMSRSFEFLWTKSDNWIHVSMIWAFILWHSICLCCLLCLGLPPLGQLGD